MQIQPRQQLLDVWRATARLSYPDSSWHFGGREGANSISDAEQLLCILAPATEIPLFRLDNPDVANRDVLDSLAQRGYLDVQEVRTATEDLMFSLPHEIRADMKARATT